MEESLPNIEVLKLDFMLSIQEQDALNEHEHSRTVNNWFCIDESKSNTSMFSKKLRMFCNFKWNIPDKFNP